MNEAVLTRLSNDRCLAEAAARRSAIEQAAIIAMFAAAAEEEKRPYTRPGYPSHLLFTRTQWENYDSWNATWDSIESRYGRLHPSLFSPTMRATTRRIT